MCASLSLKKERKEKERMREQKRTVNLSLFESGKKERNPQRSCALAEEEARRIGVVIINSSSSFGDHFSDFRDPKSSFFFL